MYYCLELECDCCIYKWLKEDRNRFVSEQVIVVFCKNAIGYVDLVGVDQWKGFKDFRMYGVLVLRK